MQTTLTQQIVPISDFRIRQGETLEQMANGPVYLAQRSKPVAVLVAADQWDSAMTRLHRLELMFAQQEFERQFADIEADNCPPSMTLEDFEELEREIISQSSIARSGTAKNTSNSRAKLQLTRA